jgi:hypothetical protein
MKQQEIKYFVSPMSLEVVNAVLDISKSISIFGFIPTRRQVDYNSGYVNNWTTSTFSSHINKKVYTIRDHGGPDQGNLSDDGVSSFIEDSKYLDAIHIDPWIKYPTVTQGLDYTVQIIKLTYSLNPNIKYEVLTEQAIRFFNINQITFFIEELKNRLTEQEFNNIQYGVIQSGVRIDLVDRKNTGDFDIDRLNSMIKTVKKFGIKTKEHNGDYLTQGQLNLRFNQGLDSINIGPEIVQLQTDVYLDNINTKQLNSWYSACIQSGKWKKWQTSTFNLDDKEQVIKVCGHYVYDSKYLPKVQDKVKKKLNSKLYELYEATI